MFGEKKTPAHAHTDSDEWFIVMEGKGDIETDGQTHILGADVARKGDVTDTGLSLYYINSRLDGKDFLDFYRVSPSISGFVARNWFARGAYVYADKSIIENPDRDADTHSLELDMYVFRRGLRSYFNARPSTR